MSLQYVKITEIFSWRLCFKLCLICTIRGDFVIWDRIYREIGLTWVFFLHVIAFFLSCVNQYHHLCVREGIMGLEKCCFESLFRKPIMDLGVRGSHNANRWEMYNWLLQADVSIVFFYFFMYSFLFRSPYNSSCTLLYISEYYSADTARVPLVMQGFRNWFQW